MPRKYDYEYDDVGRFVKAAFLQKESPLETNWSNQKMDFTVDNISYDANGNLLTMNQRGVLPGASSPVIIDKLEYTYKTTGDGTWSNQLQKVFDNNTSMTTANNGLLGDFKDEQFGVNGNDYEFDGNGNLTKDHNKKIRTGTNAGIVYNYFDKPQKITLENKSVVEFTYLSDGTKLAKKVTYTPTPTSFVTTWYCNGFIYEEKTGQAGKQLVSILHEEGRIRVYKLNANSRITQGNYVNLQGTDVKGVFEFFVKDHLQSTRMLLTEELYEERHDCKMELANASYEQAIFGNTVNNEVANTRFNQSSIPGAQWINSEASSTQVSRVGMSKKIGPNIFFKIMAGDRISAKVDYLYRAGQNSGTGTSLTNAVTGSILNILNGNSHAAGIKPFAGNINNALGITGSDLSNFLQPQTATSTNQPPQAYLNILFFDENFNFVNTSVLL